MKCFQCGYHCAEDNDELNKIALPFYNYLAEVRWVATVHAQQLVYLMFAV